MISKPTLCSIGLCVALVSGCATLAPAELNRARDAYSRSASGLSGRLSPTELYEARKALDQANQEFERSGDTQELRYLAYIATRKIELADVRARTELDRQKIAEAVKQGVVVRDEQAKESREALNQTRALLQGERREAALKSKELKQELNATRDQLASEAQARQTSEARLAAAMKDLATIAAIKEEARGMVITLNGSVLFPFGQSTLLETAKVRLEQVAAALKEQGDDKRITVEGHTDNIGSDAFNRPLSEARAWSVRNYLVIAGVDPSRIVAVGMGASRPIVSNSSAENRANNRRVEIIISSSSLTSR